MTRKTTLLAAAAALALGIGGYAVAQSKMDHGQMHHGTMDHGAMMQAVPDNAAPSTKAFIEANNRMHADMAIDFTGDADADFIRGMIPHHQGAVEMARIVLEHGKDADVRKLAEAIIAAQETEISWMQDWLKANGK